MSQRDRKAAEATFDKRQKRDAEIAGVLKQEDGRREATMKNMQRLRALRINATRKIRARGKSKSVLDLHAPFKNGPRAWLSSRRSRGCDHRASHGQIFAVDAVEA